MLFYVNERLRNPCIIPKKERVYVIQMPRERHECTFIIKMVNIEIQALNHTLKRIAI